MTGTVVYGANNIFTVHAAGENIRCRLKGKTLRTVRDEYNPLAPGDRVELDPASGMIRRRLERKNAFRRWNRKRERMQTIAANLDLVVCVCCAGVPPFRPRFVDRVGVVAEQERLSFVVAYNKDEGETPDGVRQRLDTYSDLGYEVLRCSAKSGKGVAALAERCTAGTALFMGQSGVGKSSLVNCIVKGAAQRIGEISQKHERGRHTTSAGILLSDGVHSVVDTPGIREIDLYPLTEQEIGAGFREIKAHAGTCTLPSCTHIHEPGCAVRSAVAAAEIDPDRYESFLRAVRGRQESARRAGEFYK